MSNVFDCIKFATIVQPGQVFILMNKGCDLVDPRSLYTIRTDQEIAAALYLDINIINGELMSVVECSEAELIADDTYMIKVLCLNKEEGRLIVVYFLLYRLKTFREELSRIREISHCVSWM